MRRNKLTSLGSTALLFIGALYPPASAVRLRPQLVSHLCPFDGLCCDTCNFHPRIVRLVARLGMHEHVRLLCNRASYQARAVKEANKALAKNYCQYVPVYRKPQYAHAFGTGSIGTLRICLHTLTRQPHRALQRGFHVHVSRLREFLIEVGFNL